MNEEEELNRLGESLFTLSRSDSAMPEKDRLKTHLMGMIKDSKEEGVFARFKRRVAGLRKNAPFGGAMPFGLSRLIVALKRAAKTAVVPSWARVMMKERILEYAESGRSLYAEDVFSTAGLWYRRVTALAVLTVFSLAIVVVLPEKHAVTYAKSTYLDEVSGEVYIKRNLEMVKASAKMFLREGDIVVSENESFATVRFFDDSVGRLDENSRLRIEKLSAGSAGPASTMVEIYLEDGRLWARVVNLVEESGFFVGTDDLKAGVESRAAFDVCVESESTRVAVFENTVNVVSGGEDSVETASKTVVAGYRAEAAEGPEGDLKIEKLPRNEMLNPTNTWIAGNLDNDAQYNRSLIEDKERDIEEAAEKAGGEEAVLKSLSLPGAEDETVRVEEAFAVLAEAEASLLKGDKEAGSEGLKSFSEITCELAEDLSALKEKDPAAAENLRKLMLEKTSVHLKDLASFLPDNSLYAAKEAMQELELALAENEVERAEIRLRQAGDILLEMEALIAADKAHLASTLLKRYENRTNGITMDLTEENMKQVKERFANLIEGQAEHMKTLTAIENSIIYLDQKDLKDRVKEVRADTLRKFVIALEQMPEMAPAGVLNDVKDLYATYVDDGEGGEKDMIEPVYDKLAEDESRGVIFINPNMPEVPSEMGIFVMVPLESTADVKSGVAKWSDPADGKQAKNKSY